MPIPPGVGAQQLQVLLIASGCNPCHIGDQVGFRAIVATPPGAGASVELKAGARLPDGSTVSFLEQATLVSVPAPVLFTLNGHRDLSSRRAPLARMRARLRGTCVR
jgi:hypothetical protein